jgi:hypothetical protein
MISVMVAGVPLRRAIWRKMFSTITTAPSTRMPKSMAPIDRRLAEAFWTFRQAKANRSANGMVVATISPARKS